MPVLEGTGGGSTSQTPSNVSEAERLRKELEAILERRRLQGSRDKSPAPGVQTSPPQQLAPIGPGGATGNNSWNQEQAAQAARQQVREIERQREEKIVQLRTRAQNIARERTRRIEALRKEAQNRGRMRRLAQTEYGFDATSQTSRENQRQQMLEELRREVLEPFEPQLAELGFGERQKVIADIEKEILEYVENQERQRQGAFQDSETRAMQARDRGRSRRLNQISGLGNQAQQEFAKQSIEKAVRTNDAPTIRRLYEDGSLAWYYDQLAQGKLDEGFGAVGRKLGNEELQGAGLGIGQGDSRGDRVLDDRGRVTFRKDGIASGPLTTADFSSLVFDNILNDQELAQVRNITSGFDQIQATTLQALGTGLEYLGKPLEELSAQPFYAAQLARNRGSGRAEQLSAGFSNLPGLSLIGLGERQRRLFGDETNTYEERQELRERGEIASFGEVVSGEEADVLNRDALANAGGEGFRFSPGIEEVLSGTGDIFFSVALDPLTYTPFVINKTGLASPTARAARAALRGLEREVKNLSEDAVKRVARTMALNEDVSRKVLTDALKDEYASKAVENYLSNSRVGQALEAEVRRIAAEATDVEALRKAMPGLPTTTAVEIASSKTSREAAMDLASQALRSREYVPDISLRRQAAVLATGRGLNAPTLVGLGPRVLRQQRGLFDVVNHARRVGNASKHGPVAVWASRTSTARSGIKAMKTAVRRTNTVALRKSGIRIADAERAVLESVAGMTPFDRINQVLLLVDGADVEIQDAVESTLEKLIPKSATPSEFSRKMAELPPSKLEALLEVETLLATAYGEVGDDAARKHLLTELSIGQGMFENDLGVHLAMRRAARRNERLTSRNSVFSKWTVGELTDKIALVPNEDLRNRLMAMMRSQKLIDPTQVVDKRNSMFRTVALASDAGVADDAWGLVTRHKEALLNRDELLGGARVGLGTRLNPVRALGKVITSLDETVAPLSIKFLASSNMELAIQKRVEALDSYMGALGVDEFARQTMRQAVSEVQTERDLHDVVKRMLQVHARAHGISDEGYAVLDYMFNKAVVDEAKRVGFKTAQDDILDEAGNIIYKRGELVREIQNLSQLKEVVPLPDPVDVHKTIRQLERAMGDPDKVAAIRKAIENPNELVGFLKGTGNYLHRTWKLMVVTNLFMPVVGGFVGFVGTEGDIEDKLKGSAQGAAIGLLAPARYVLRIGIEETMRRLLGRGRFVPAEFIPVLAKKYSLRGVDIPFSAGDMLHGGNPVENTAWVRNRMWAHGTGEMEAAGLADADGLLAKLNRKSSRYVDGWGRIVNFQINEGNGPLDRWLLGVRAGYISEEKARKLFDEWLKTDEGAVWWRRWSQAGDSVAPPPKTPQEAFDRQSKLIEDYFPPEIARHRLPSIDADFQKVHSTILKGHVRRKTAPAYIHVEKTWTLPRGSHFFRDMAALKDKALETFVFEKPTQTFNRQPMARAIYGDEYRKLVALGVPKERAAALADAKAVNVTNDIMFNQNNESRFAKKIDFIFPFQQPREELVRVWAPMLLNNKIHVLNVTRLGVRAFENGAASGIFYEHTDYYTGQKEWRMKIPGSASLSRALGGVNAHFDFGLKDLLFITQGTTLDNMGVPSVGGWHFSLLSRYYIDAFPDHYDSLPSTIKDYLFPYGASGRIFRAEPSRLWMAYMNSPAPWEFASKERQTDELEKVRKEMYLTLKFENGGREPTEEELDDAMRAFFKTHATIGAIWPASSRYVQPYQEMLDKAMSGFRLPNGELDYFAFVNEYPWLQPYISDRNDFVGPDDFKTWSRTEEEKANDYIKGWIEQKPFDQWRRELRDFQLTSEAWSEWQQIQFVYPDDEVGEAYLRWEQRWLDRFPEVVSTSRSNYFRDAQLNRIEHMAEGPLKDRALNEWRTRHGVTATAYGFHRQRLLEEGWEVNFWKASRPSELVVDFVETKTLQDGISEESAVRLLNPAEQVKWWKHKQAELDYIPETDDLTNPEDGAQQIIENYHFYGDQIRDLYRKYPPLQSDNSKKTDLTRLVNEWRGAYGDAISSIYDEINVVSARFDELKEAKQSWSAEGQALYKKRSDLYDLVSALRARQFQNLPGLIEYQDDVQAAMALIPDGYSTSRAYRAAMQNLSARGIGYGGYISSNEELSYLNMSDEVKSAYIADLQQQLDLPNEKGTKGKLFWEWLTPFQQNLLEQNLPGTTVRDWKDVTPEDATGGGSGRKPWVRWRRGGRGYWRGYGTIAQDELSYAYAMFKQYTQRPDGAKPPPAYAEYLKLPANPMVRNQFLDQHPEVAEWIRLGPMANMPEYLRYVVANIMIKHGKWEGEVTPDEEVVGLSWARQQLSRWNLRGDERKPAAYDVWLNMPTGVEKREYLRKHPEIERWIQLGPMRNMPDAYQDVIRDIMIRYGEWTQTTDPLSLAIRGYYKTPTYAREQYLEKHPELVDYWNMIQSPQEKKMSEMVDQYFSIDDPNARSMFLIMHPELKSWFVERRNKRYEDFVNKVALYMGSNPEMFEHYLERQEDVLNDLLQRYATPQLVREIRPLADAKVKPDARSRIRRS